MKLPVLIFIFSFLFFQLGIAQKKYGFIPKEYNQLSEKQLQSNQILIGPDVLLFSSRGKLLSQSQMSLMTNPEFKPTFFADKNGEIKALVFERSSNNPILIEKNPEASYDKGELAKDFIITDLDGNHIKLSELRGKVVVLNFWFIKCKPCIDEIPQLNELKNNYSSDDVVFLAITFDKNELVEQFLEKHTFNYTIAGNAMDAIKIHGVNSYPTNMILNSKGEIALKEIGYRTNIRQVLEATIDKLLQ